MKERFRKIASKISTWTGSAWAFTIALSVVVIWALSGSAFSYSSTWQLVINTGTTIVTFLMVFLIQNTQNRDGKAMQIKLDELIRATRARDSFMDVEDLTDDELETLDQEFRTLHEKQVASANLHKLHTKIKAEHKRRTSLQEAGEILNMFNPLSGFGNRDNDKK